MPTLKFLSVTDEVTSCDCCVKTNLKCTVMFADDTDNVLYYGRTCATRNSGKKLSEWEAIARKDMEARRKAARVRWLNHPAYLAERAKYAERDRLKLPPERASRDFVREASNAAHEAKLILCDEFHIEHWQI